MDGDPVLTTLLEAVDIPHESLSIRYVRTFKKPGTVGCSVVYHTASLCAHPQFFSSTMIVIHWLKCVPHGCLQLIP